MLSIKPKQHTTSHSLFSITVCNVRALRFYVYTLLFLIGLSAYTQIQGMHDAIVKEDTCPVSYAANIYTDIGPRCSPVIFLPASY